MKLMPNKDRSRLTRAALGLIQCDLSIDNVRLVNVITGEVYPAGVDVIDGVICRIRTDGSKCEPAAKVQYDGNDEYLVPGFIDTHMHVESTMMTPENFGKTAVVWGTTTAVTDPHEIGNVMGVPGVKFMLESAKNSPMRIYVLAPSCVPSVPALEGAGATFMKPEIKEMLSDEDVIGVAEIMDYVGVYTDDKRMHDIVDAGIEENGFLQGHCPGLTGNALCAYLDGGPVSDHEARRPEEVREKLRLGMHINIKASSLSDTASDLFRSIRDIPWTDDISICTDDVHAADLIKTGHINHVVNECIKSGVDPMLAIRFGTFNAAREYNFEDAGRIAPGCIADMQIVSCLDMAKHPSAVFAAGKLVAKDGKVTGEEQKVSSTPGVNTVNIPFVTGPESFQMKAEGSSVNTLVFNTSRSLMRPNVTPVYETFPVENGVVVLPDKSTRQFLCIMNRYGADSKTIAVCSEFNILHGCVASTISHDSHNMTLAYTDPADAYVAAKELERIGGGMTFVENGKVVCSLPLEVAGLMSPLPAEELAEKIRKMDEAVSYACDNRSPMLLQIAVLALPVRPGIIITDRGIVNGDTQEFIPQVIG